MEKFTNLYQIARTLRFGLEPVGKTKKNFDDWIKNLQTDKLVENTNNLFAKDQNIKDAYFAIKPIMDKLHEQFIEKSLTSDEAKNIDFSEYLNAFRDKDVRRSKKFEELEKRKRTEIGATYKAGERLFLPKIENAIKEQKEKKANGGKKKDENPNDGSNKKAKPYECLTKREMLFYLSANVKELAIDNNLDEQKLDKHIKQFDGFWGYLSGYNQNRKNYYEVEKESSTAVATRIVHENLPIFCSNILLFEEHREEYLSIYQNLKDNNIETMIKNAAGAEIEAEAISQNVFQIEHFNNCLAQTQIEEYNRIIGNYNSLINLYKQAHSDSKIDEFERLKKQIGCGKKKSMFAALIKDRQSELTDEQRKKEIEEGATLTVETLLKKAKEAGDRMFDKNDDNDNEITTIPAFIKFLQRCNNWNGIYMSKSTISKISSLYFADWHSIEEKFVEWSEHGDKEQKEKVKACCTYDKKREQPLKLLDAVELSGFFEALDTVQPEHFFKEWLFKDDETNEYCGVLDNKLSTSRNLINLLCKDIERYTNNFLENSDEIVKKENYKDENSKAGEEGRTIKEIKEWFDAATDAMRIVRYFAVRRSKMKGSIPNKTMEQALSNLLFNDDAQWFKWYDLIRNYLTKKPQDDVKENTLKLNFDSSSFLKESGWDKDYSKKWSFYCD